MLKDEAEYTLKAIIDATAEVDRAQEQLRRTREQYDAARKELAEARDRREAIMRDAATPRPLFDGPTSTDSAEPTPPPAEPTPGPSPEATGWRRTRIDQLTRVTQDVVDALGLIGVEHVWQLLSLLQSGAITDLQASLARKAVDPGDALVAAAALDCFLAEEEVEIPDDELSRLTGRIYGMPERQVAPFMEEPIVGVSQACRARLDEIGIEVVGDALLRIGNPLKRDLDYTIGVEATAEMMAAVATIRQAVLDRGEQPTKSPARAGGKAKARKAEAI